MSFDQGFVWTRNVQLEVQRCDLLPSILHVIGWTGCCQVMLWRPLPLTRLNEGNDPAITRDSHFLWFCQWRLTDIRIVITVNREKMSGIYRPDHISHRRIGTLNRSPSLSLRLLMNISTWNVASVRARKSPLPTTSNTPIVPFCNPTAKIAPSEEKPVSRRLVRSAEGLTGWESHWFDSGIEFQENGGDVARRECIVDQEFTRFSAENDDIPFRVEICTGDQLLDEREREREGEEEGRDGLTGHLIDHSTSFVWEFHLKR